MNEYAENYSNVTDKQQYLSFKEGGESIFMWIFYDFVLLLNLQEQALEEILPQNKTTINIEKFKQA